MLYKNFRKVLYSLEPEVAHSFAEKGMKFLTKTPILKSLWHSSHSISSPRLQQTIFGESFSNPIGLGAGFDKNGTMVKEIDALGFGFTEVGTITPKPQKGNPKPRIFRHTQIESLQNAMGFNNDGMEVAYKNLSIDFPFPVGINIGKNKITAQDKAVDDYIELIDRFHKMASYIVINISSPNTPNLRDLQNIEFIQHLIFRAKTVTTKPILIKIAPDMSIENGVELSALAVEKGASGIIATNTTTDYSLVETPAPFGGGLSGNVLRERSFTIFDEIAKELYGKAVLISVGGIDSGKEAYRRIQAGASLVQVYTALIYKGPSLVRKMNLELLKLLERDGFSNISEAIGSKR